MTIGKRDWLQARAADHNSSRRVATARSFNLLQELSDQAVLETILSEGPITRPEVARLTGLSKPTVSASVRRLVQSHLVRATGLRAGRPGRPPISYVVDSTAGFVVGIDVGASNLRIAAVDIYGVMLVTREQVITSQEPEAIGQQMVALVQTVIRTASATHGQFLALGTSLPGSDLGEPGSEAQNQESSPAAVILERLQQSFDVPILIDQGFNLSAIGEKWRGVAKGVADFVFITIGARVGMSIVVANEIVRGAHGVAGEISRMPLGLQSSTQRQGAHPRFDDEVSNARVLATLSRSNMESRWKNEDEEAEGTLEIIEAEAELIGYAVATVCATLDPELIVLGGRIGSNPALLQPVRQAAMSFLPISARIETSVLHGNAPLYGALSLGLREARDQLFKRNDFEGISAASFDAE